ncbi:hypothetical protein MA16_Dca024468 [Dendrobium catenatum]|uniref:Uncharacterized protein n=1 Tax=Dendrobium catenatum TaxID=906689 RepID=A0A2I0V9A5_9ASPA|nr:hypothetical protein MA16_Dca024468 [Dendrobium catenatum]
MRDKDKELVINEVWRLEKLWANQTNIIRQLEELLIDVQRLSIETRREFNSNGARTTPHQPCRDHAPAIVPGIRSGMGLDHQQRRSHQPTQEVSDSDEDFQ